MSRPGRLIHDRHAPGSDEERLARLLEDAPAADTLSPEAQARIGARLAALEAAPVRGWILPSLCLAGAAGLALLVWQGREAEVAQHASLPTAPVARVEVLTSPGSALELAGGRLVLVGAGRMRREDGGVRVEQGTISVESAARELAFETPSARVLVAPRSRLEVTVGERAVRIAASAGSAQILYYDGHVELVEPVRAPAPEASRPPRAVANRDARGPRAPGSTADADLVEPELPTALGLERASLSAALERMRTDPARALDLLDRHLAAHPHGDLHAEAERARVALLLRLERRAEALGALDRMAEPPAELRVVRAELRAEGGRCQDAVGDFNHIALSGDDRFEERALFGRAGCRQRLGDEDGAREDLERGLARYPRGTFADRARAALAKLRRR